jgi:predicted HNH restriction endonuclease
MKEEQKLKITKGLKAFYESHPEKKITREKAFKQASSHTKGKYRQRLPDTILELSKRTVAKIFKRLGVGCSNCGWNVTACDIHHIRGKKIPNPHSHDKLAYLCPNCHRMAHYGILKPEDLKTLTSYIGEKWKDVYYG